VKLFDRKGNYLRDIGHEGRGPGEYMMLYSAAIDEKNETIYVMPWMTDQLLAFGIDGTPKEPVKLAHNSPKGVFNVNADGTFSIAIVPVGDASVWAWTQDAEGNVVNEIANPKAGQPIDFSSEIGAGKNNGEFDPFLMMFGNKDNDTLGRYNTQTGAMEPLFTVSNIQSKEPPYYSYTQLPRHFIGNYAPGMEQVSENTSVATAPINFIVDRETLRGAPYVLTIDELGGLGAWPNFTQGYFIGNWPAINLKKDLEKLLSSGDVTDPAMIERVTALNDSLDDEDNNILILARLRK
jgi:hypothetical protein